MSTVSSASNVEPVGEAELVVGGMVWRLSPEGFLTIRGIGHRDPRAIGVLQTPEELERLGEWLHRLAQDQIAAEAPGHGLQDDTTDTTTRDSKR